MAKQPELVSILNKAHIIQIASGHMMGDVAQKNTFFEGVMQQLQRWWTKIVLKVILDLYAPLLYVYVCICY